MQPFRIKPHRIFSRAPRPLSGAISNPENQARVLPPGFLDAVRGFGDALTSSRLREIIRHRGVRIPTPEYGTRIADILRSEGVPLSTIVGLASEDRAQAARSFTQLRRRDGSAPPVDYLDYEASFSADYAALYPDTARGSVHDMVAPREGDTVTVQIGDGEPVPLMADRVRLGDTGVEMELSPSTPNMTFRLDSLPSMIEEFERTFSERVRETARRVGRALRFGILYGNTRSMRYDFDVTSVPTPDAARWRDLPPIRRYENFGDVARDFGTPSLELSFDLAHGEWRRVESPLVAWAGWPWRGRRRRSRAWTPPDTLETSKSLSTAIPALMRHDPCPPVRAPGMIGQAFALVERSKEGVSSYPGKQARFPTPGNLHTSAKMGANSYPQNWARIPSQKKRARVSTRRKRA